MREKTSGLTSFFEKGPIVVSVLILATLLLGGWQGYRAHLEMNSWKNINTINGIALEIYSQNSDLEKKLASLSKPSEMVERVERIRSETEEKWENIFRLVPASYNETILTSLRSISHKMVDHLGNLRDIFRDGNALSDGKATMILNTHRQNNDNILVEIGKTTFFEESSSPVVYLFIGLLGILGFILSLGFHYRVLKPLDDYLDKIRDLPPDQLLTRDIRESNIEIAKIRGILDGALKPTIELRKRIGSVGSDLFTTANAMSKSTIKLEAAFNDQLQSTEKVFRTAKDISHTSKELVNTMSDVAHLSTDTAESATASRDDLEKMRSMMSSLESEAVRISERLADINEKASNITSVITTITKVADQTNLLSLNAAIEAEKAGEYGSGFAVVATEIRRLADQTAVATLDIEQMIKEMKAAVSSGVMGMEKFGQAV